MMVSRVAPLAEALHSDGQCMTVVGPDGFSPSKILNLKRKIESRGAGSKRPTRL